MNTTATSQPNTLATDDIAIGGMTCGHCEATVTNAIKGIDPHAIVTIDRSSGRVDVQSESPRHAFAAAIADEGYTVEKMVEKAAGGCGGHCSCN